MALFSRHRSYTEKVLAFRNKNANARKDSAGILVVGLRAGAISPSFESIPRSCSRHSSKAIAVLSFPLPVGAVTLFGKSAAA